MLLSDRFGISNKRIEHVIVFDEAGGFPLMLNSALQMCDLLVFLQEILFISERIKGTQKQILLVPYISGLPEYV